MRYVLLGLAINQAVGTVGAMLCYTFSKSLRDDMDATHRGQPLVFVLSFITFSTMWPVLITCDVCRNTFNLCRYLITGKLPGDE